jgi:tetratricopeptide (TPR) repeat protein
VAKPLNSRVLRACSLLLLLMTGCLSALGQRSAVTESTRAFYRGDYAKASELAMAHLRRFPNDVPVLVILARAEFAQNKFDQALADLQKALTADPANIDALFYLSLLAKERSRKENERLYSLAPNSDRVYQLLGETALAAENQATQDATAETKAEGEFQKALKINPRAIEVLTELAQLKRSQWKFDEAIKYYTQAEQASPLTYEIAYGLGASYASKREYPQAIEWLQKAVVLAPDSADGHFALGNALIQNGQFEAAIPELKASRQLDPRMKQAYFLLGRAYSKLGRPEEAKVAFQKVDELSRAEGQGAPKSDDAAPTKP